MIEFENDFPVSVREKIQKLESYIALKFLLKSLNDFATDTVMVKRSPITTDRFTVYIDTNKTVLTSSNVDKEYEQINMRFLHEGDGVSSGISKFGSEVAHEHLIGRMTYDTTDIESMEQLEAVFNQFYKTVMRGIIFTRRHITEGNHSPIAAIPVAELIAKGYTKELHTEIHGK